ncbi:MAG: hypothetical protein ABJE00_00090 [Erythrobacter sp.]
MRSSPLLDVVIHCISTLAKGLLLGTSPYSIRLDDTLRQSLEREAEIEDRPPTQLAVRAIRAMLESKAAKRAAIEIAFERADQGEFISAEAMNDWIDSWDTEDEDSAPEADIAPNRV